MKGIRKGRTVRRGMRRMVLEEIMRKMVVE